MRRKVTLYHPPFIEVADAYHPQEVPPNREVSWYVIGHVAYGPIPNIGVSYFFLSGPSTYITLVKQDGSEVKLPVMSGATVYSYGSNPTSTKVDSRSMYRGVKFPTEGTYKILLMAGSLVGNGATFGPDEYYEYTVTVKEPTLPTPTLWFWFTAPFFLGILLYFSSTNI